MSDLRDDLRFAARLLRKSPGFTAVAVLSLALAIGANTAIFSVVNGVLLRPLPFPDPHRLFQVVRHDPGRDDAPLSVPQYAFLLRQEQPFSMLAAWPVIDSGFNLVGEGPPERIAGARVTRSFFEVHGGTPTVGRGFLPEEDRPEGARVVVLGHELWQRRYQGSPEAVGRSVTINGELYTIVGVAPPGFDAPRRSQLWIPLRLDLTTVENTHFLAVVGRLRPEVHAGEVGALIKAQGEQLRAARPGSVRPDSWLDADELQTVRVRAVRRALWVLLGAVGLVLLIACVNLANLQLARTGGRERELAVRTALGASPRRIIRQLLTESVLLSGAGGAAGLLLASWGLPALLAQVPDGIPLMERVQIDGVVLVFTLGVSTLAGLLFGVLPAWHASVTQPRGSLQVGVPRETLGGVGSRTRWFLVMSQMALAGVLLVGAFLLTKSLVLLRGESPGFEGRDVVTMRLSLPEVRYGNPQVLESFGAAVMERVRALPGVQEVGLALTLPFESGIRLDVTVEGRPPVPDKTGHGTLHYRPVSRGYFEALKLEAVQGRLLDELDRHGSRPVVVINEAAARLYWPGEDPVGKRIWLGRSIPEIADPEPREIIGVARNVRELGVHEPPPPIAYVPPGQMPPPLLVHFLRLSSQSLVIRSVQAGGPMAEDLTRVVQSVDPAQSVTRVVSMEELLSRSLNPRRFNVLLLGLMAGLAVVLAGVGLYGVASYRVTQRAREIGVRMALGARRRAVVWLAVRHGLSAVGVGAGLGLMGAAQLTWVLDHLLYGVSPVDAGVFLAVPAVLMGVALVALWLPAWRAARVDPMVALRSE